MSVLPIHNFAENCRFLLVNPAKDMEETHKLLSEAYFGKIEIDTAHGMEGALKMLAIQAFDCVICDTAAESFSEQAFPVLVRAAGQAPVLILTAKEADEQSIRLMQAGAQDYVVKHHANIAALRRILLYTLERAKFRRHLYENENLFMNFVRSAPAAIAMFDSEMRYVLHSERWLEDYNLTGPLVGKSHYEVFPDVPDRWKELHRRCLRGETIKNPSDEFLRADGSIEYIQWEIMPWRMLGKIGGIIMFTEVITEKVRMQLELEALNNQLEQTIEHRTAELQRALKMAEESERAKTDFFTNLTHELRTPLHAILNFSGFAKEKYGKVPEEQIRGYLDKIERSGERLLNLVNDVLDLAKTKDMRGGIHLEKIDLLALINDAIADLQSLAEKRGISVTLECTLPKAEAMCDAQRISQVMVNLLSNAYKFTREQSTVKVTVQAAPHEKGALQVTVCDQGDGIPESELESVFDEFSQSNKVRSGTFVRGTGLGLAICRQIVQAHHGRIWAKNTPEGGAVLHFTLPQP